MMNSSICTGCLNIVTSIGHTSVDIDASPNLESVDNLCYLSNMFIVDGDADADKEARIRIRWNKFRQLVPGLTNINISLITRARLFSSLCKVVLHGSKTGPVRKGNEVTLQRTEMRMV